MVTTMRRLQITLAVIAVLLASLFGAQAAVGYPVTPNAQIMASTTAPYGCESIEVSGTNFHPNEDVAIYLGSTKVATAHTNGSGSFDPQVKIPNVTGALVLKGVGASGSADDVSTLTLTVKAGCSTGGTGGGSGGGSILGSTGVQIGAMVVAAAVLLGAGAFFVTAGRRRKVRAHA